MDISPSNYHHRPQTMDVTNHLRTIIHIDMDCFYAQVEEIRDPSLRSKPLGIQQKNFIVTSNYVARDYGVTKMMLLSEAKKLCPHLVLVNGEDLTNYRQMSNKIFDVLQKYTPFVEKLGFDENFLDVTNIVSQRLNTNPSGSFATNIPGCIYPPEKCLEDCECGCAERLAIGAHIAKEIRHDLNKTLGITCCAGISYNKLLAKLVGSRNKPNNQTVLVSTYTDEFMRELSLAKITGIGQKTESLLLENGIGTVSDLQNCDFDTLKRSFGIETATKLNDLAFGRDSNPVRPSGKPKTIGLEDSCKPLSIRKDVEERYRLLLSRLVGQVSEDGRIPIAIKIIIRRFDPIKKTSHRETKQANIMPSLFKQLPDGQIMLADSAQDTLMKLIMRLFEKVVDMSKSFNITLLGLAFSKFQERKNGTSSIANFLIKKSDLEVQSITSISNDRKLPTSPLAMSPGDQFYRRRTTASPIPMHVDIESIPSDVSDFSENEIEPSPKKSRFSTLFNKRRCLSNGDTGELASPSKLRVAELRLNSRDSDKESPAAGASTIAQPIPVPVLATARSCNANNSTSSSYGYHNHDSDMNSLAETGETMITGNLANIPCPSGVDPDVFYQLPSDVQNELISTWARSATATATVPNGAGNATAPANKNTLYRYFIRNK